VRLGRLERPLNALSTHSLCQLGYRRIDGRSDDRHREGMEDQAGFEPAMSLRCRLKRPARSAATVTGPLCVCSGGREWLRSTGRRVKSPLPLHSGLRLRVRILGLVGGTAPPATRLSGAPVASPFTRMVSRWWCALQVLPLLPRPCRGRALLIELRTRTPTRTRTLDHGV
jgi:hypothetical protein